LELYNWVMRGNRRRKILKALNRPKLPTELTYEAKMSLTNVSKTLNSFEQKGIVRCITPHNKTGKIYSLTEKGKGLREEIVGEA
jgi:DNA-binding MarR family transcriptional regulator